MSRRVRPSLRILPNASYPMRTALPLRPLIRSASTASSGGPQAATVPPESPRYTPGLENIQPQYGRKPRIRGILPVPRNILNRVDESGNPRYAKDNAWTTLQKSVLKPEEDSASTQATTQSKDQHEAGRLAWKKRMSLNRRQNLVQGVIDLKTRQAKDRHYENKRREQRRKENRALRAERAARQDVNLTSPTITTAMRLQHGRIPDPNREARVSEKRARVQVIEDRKAADRQEALHTLYMNARDFIVTEEQLEKAVDKCFGSANSPRIFGHHGVSIWHHQKPEGVEEKLERATRTKRSAKDTQGLADTARARLQKIAEELTGGKIS